MTMTTVTREHLAGLVLALESGAVTSPDMRESVRKMIAQASAAPEQEADDWIAVSDRLPDVNDHVIVAAEFFGPGDWRIKVGGLEEDGSWTVFGASWTPSHWQPLPVAPRHVASATAQTAEVKS